MRHRILVPALLVPLLTLADAAPASAQFDFGSWWQRAQMIANQLTQIANQTRQIRSMTRQLTELENQLRHMERAARGEIDALARSFSALSADPVGLVRDGLSWRSDFTGDARALADRVSDFGDGGSVTALWQSAQHAADRVSESQLLSLYRTDPPQVAVRAARDWRRARDDADRQRVLDYALLDAAASLAETVEGAEGSFDELAANGNLSATALQQARVAAALSQGRVHGALGQLLAYQAAQEASRARMAELARLERLAQWRDDRERAVALAAAMQRAAELDRPALRNGLRLLIPSFYGRQP